MASANNGKNKGIENLKPFPKGISGNPNGRPKIPEDVKNAFRAHTMEAKNTLVEIMRDTENRAGDRVRAAEVVLNRGWGTPEHAIAVSGSVATVEVDTSKLGKKDQDALLNALAGIYSGNATMEDEAEITD